jgi:peroxiredoxin
MTDLHSVDWSKIPPPSDDGAARHLRRMRLPAVALPATDGHAVDLSAIGGRSVVYAYPMTGRPGVALPEGWDMIPGARGCTPQACAFRDHFTELKRHGVDHVFGLSTQNTADQREAAGRLHLPFALLSDAHLQLTEAIRLPTFSAAGLRLLRRLTMIVEAGRVAHVLYSVFPPDRSAQDVIDWLAGNAE